MGASTDLQAGDIRVIETEDERSLVFVVKVTASHVVWSPVHTYVEYATANDLVVSQRASGLRYPLVICSAIRATALSEQFDPTAITRLPGDCILAVLRTYDGHDTSAVDGRWWTGSPLIGCLDARWEFKAAVRQQVTRHAEPSLLLLLD